MPNNEQYAKQRKVQNDSGKQEDMNVHLVPPNGVSVEPASAITQVEEEDGNQLELRKGAM
tara:strand:- start:834 stop:1013 length:180 start_codon:yes stop_codon:yes gene_type:complete